MITQRTTKQTLEYLKENGFEITERTLRRDKKRIKEKNLKRLYEITKLYFGDQHIERIQKLRYIEQKLWNDCNECQDPYKRSKIRESIANLQPIISSFIDITRYAIEKVYPDKRFKEIEESNDNDYYQNIDGSRLNGSNLNGNSNSISNNIYRDPPPTVF